MIFHKTKPDQTKYTFLLLKNRLIGLVGWVFNNGPGELGSIHGRVIPKTQKMVLDTSLLKFSNIRYVSSVKWNNPVKGVAPSPKPRCCSYWKGSLLVALNYGRHPLKKFAIVDVEAIVTVFTFREMFLVWFKSHCGTRTPLPSNLKLTLVLIRRRVMFWDIWGGWNASYKPLNTICK